MKKFLPFLSMSVLLILLVTPNAFGHAINYAMERANGGEVAAFYTKLGVAHIIPYGFDHILFISGLCLLSTRIKTVLIQASAFTLAHTVTLGLSMMNVIKAPSAIIEPIIALSITFIAIENILLGELKPWRILVVFLFGLVHGMGFASVLSEIGLPRNQFYSSILFFNLGVEMGQVAIIALIFVFIILPLGRMTWYKRYIINPVSFLIAATAFFWTIERLTM